jgi:ribosomal protein S25
MEKLSAWLSSQMTDDKKINELGSSIKECLVILEKAKAYETNEEASQSANEKKATSQKPVPPNSLSTPTRNKELLLNFEKHMRESLKNSKSFDYEVTVSMARSILMKLENEGRLSLENLTNEFEEKMKSMARNKISKQKLNAVEIGILNHKLQDSFKKAQQDEAMQQISLEKMRSTLSTNA